MADRKITDLTALAAGSQATGDLLTIVDVSEGAAADKNKKITVESLFKGIPGDVGIGTSSPSALLHISDSVNSGDVALIIQNTGTSNNTASIRLNKGSGAEPDHRIQNDTGGNLTFARGTDESTYTEQMRIDSSGNVLVGKTTTAITTVGTRIDVGSVDCSNSSNSTNLGTNSGGSIRIANTDSTDNNFSNIGGYNSNGLVANQINFINTSHSSRTGEIGFSTHNGSSLTERLRIDSSGRVGLGTTSPTALLHLNATTPVLRITGSSVGNCEIQEDGATLMINVDSSNAKSNSALVLRTDNSERMRIDSSGRVGVGTSSPAVLLHVKTSGEGQLAIGSTDASGASLYLDGDANGDVQGGDYAFLNHDSSGDLNVVNLKSGNIIFKGTSSTQRMVIGSNGNIGVGVTPTSGTRFYAQGFQIAQGITGEANGTNSFYGVYGVANNGAATQYGLYGQTNTSTSYSSGGILGYSTQSNTYGIVGYWNTSAYYSFYGNGAVAGTSFPNVSDSRLKDVDSNLTGCLDKLANIQPVKYTWKENSQQRRSMGTGVEIGLLAQEVQAQFPELVSDMGWCEIAGNNPETLNEQLGSTLGVDYGRMTAVLIQALNEAKEQIDTLKARVAALEAG